jgi:hypothetical protein
VWAPHCLVFNVTRGRGNEAACGLHAASDLILDALGRREMRWNVASMPSPRPSTMPQEGGETKRGHVGFTRPHWVLDSSLVPVFLLTLIPLLFLSSFTFANYWLLSWLVSWQLSDWLMTWARAMVGGDDGAPTSLNEGRGSRWLGGSRWGGVLKWWDLKKIQHTTWLFHKQTNIFGHMIHVMA